MIKRLLLSFAVILTFTTGSTLKAQTVTIPDYSFTLWLENNFPACISVDQLDTTCPEILNATFLYFAYGNNIVNFDGLQYFDNIDSIWLESGYINNIPAFPASLEYIDLSNNQLASLPAFPPGLRELRIDNNDLTTLPALPDSLQYLQCFGNMITSLPALPASLTGLSCQVNQLTSLPTLPLGMYNLDCSINPLGTLPTLPPSLGMLTAGNSQLTQLPELPSTLQWLSVPNNQLTLIPPLPQTMGYLDVSQNANLTCLPPIATLTSTAINISSTAITCLPNIISHPGSIPMIDTLPLCGLFSSGCQVAWNVTGKTFLDENSDCTNDNTEPTLGNLKAMLYHNGTLQQQIYTNMTGQYSFDTDLNGGYSVSIDTANVPFLVTCPSNNSYSADITAVDSFDTGGDFGLTCAAGYDLGVGAIVNSSGIFFPNDTATVSIFGGDMAGYYGANCNTSGVSGTVQLTFSGAATYAGSTGLVAPTSVTGNTILWNVLDFSTINYYDAFRVRFVTNITATIGDVVCMDVIVAPNADYNAGNNTMSHCFSVMNSFDPNIKEASPIATTAPGEWISYTIHFQNTGNAPAHNILVTDQLDANLDWSTFQLNGTSHQAVTQIVENGLVKFTFLNIMLPDSTSNEPQSHGWIQYRIKAIDNLAVNTIIDNTAAIYFDFNAPVITNTTHNLYELTSISDASTKAFELTVYPNPASQVATVEYPIGYDDLSLKIVDPSGRVIAQYALPKSGKSKMELSHVPNGMYQVQLLQMDKTLVVKKLVVMR